LCYGAPCFCTTTVAFYGIRFGTRQLEAQISSESLFSFNPLQLRILKNPLPPEKNGQKTFQIMSLPKTFFLIWRTQRVNGYSTMRENLPPPWEIEMSTPSPAPLLIKKTLPETKDFFSKWALAGFRIEIEKENKIIPSKVSNVLVYPPLQRWREFGLEFPLHG
jgi:hypothetical protein